MISYNIYLCLTYFIQHQALQVHLCCWKWQDFVLFYAWVVFLCVCMYHILFICWWTLSCFHVLATVDYAAMNIGVHITCFWFRFFIYMSRSGIVGSYSSFLSSFLRHLHTMAAPIYIPTNLRNLYPWVSFVLFFFNTFALYMVKAMVLGNNYLPSVLQSIISWTASKIKGFLDAGWKIDVHFL